MLPLIVNPFKASFKWSKTGWSWGKWRKSRIKSTSSSKVSNWSKKKSVLRKSRLSGGRSEGSSCMLCLSRRSGRKWRRGRGISRWTRSRWRMRSERLRKWRERRRKRRWSWGKCRVSTWRCQRRRNLSRNKRIECVIRWIMRRQSSTIPTSTKEISRSNRSKKGRKGLTSSKRRPVRDTYSKYSR